MQVALGRLALRATTVVEDVACPVDELAPAGPDEPLTSVLSRMGASEEGRVVFHDARVVGILAPTDVSRMLQVADLWDRQPEPGAPGRSAAGGDDRRRAGMTAVVLARCSAGWPDAARAGRCRRYLPPDTAATTWGAA